MIDVHMHIGRLYVGEKPLTPRRLLRFMDSNGISRAALLPIESPEETHYYVTTEYVLGVCKRHPDRFIPFCNVDPRRGRPDVAANIPTILREYKDRGCKGLGELMCGLYVDDPLMQRIYDECAALALPMIFHLDALRDLDDIGLPRFERMIQKFPDAVFIGHGPHFWSEISGDVKVEDFGRYPSGKVAPGGAVCRLLADYPNCFADLSAGSGCNALSRDSEFGFKFLNDFQDKLMFGTDLCRNVQEIAIIPYLNDALAVGKISGSVYDKITRSNAKALFKLND